MFSSSLRIINVMLQEGKLPLYVCIYKICNCNVTINELALTVYPLSNRLPFSKRRFSPFG